MFHPLSHFPIVYIVNITAGFLLLVYSSFVICTGCSFAELGALLCLVGYTLWSPGSSLGGSWVSATRFGFFAPTLGHLLWSFGVCVSDGLRRLQHIRCCVNSHRASLSNFCVCFCLCVLFWLCCVLFFCFCVFLLCLLFFCIWTAYWTM